LDLLQKSGFNTHAMPEFLERLQRATRLLEGNAPNYLRTHPITSERIADIENRVSKQPYRLIPDSLDFQLVRTKLIAAQKSTSDALSYFNHALTDKKFGNPVAQRYGLILSLLRNNEVNKAAQEMAILNGQVKGNDLVDTLAGQVKLAAKNDADSLAFYKVAVENHPQHRALIYDYAQLLLQSGQADTAIRLLSDRISRYPADTKLYNLQAHAYQVLGLPLEQHQALAYSYAWQGNLRAAIEQLELAKQAGGSFYQMSTIESDLRELRDMADASGKK
jgi:predicted Zn-dependent protease